MYSDGIVVCLLPIGTHEFSPLRWKQFGKIRDFPFFNGNSRKKNRQFFGESASSATWQNHKKLCLLTLFWVCGSWMKYHWRRIWVWKRSLMNMRNKVKRYQAHPPLMLNLWLSIHLTVPCYCQRLGNHFTTSGLFGLMASPSSFSIFEVGDPWSILVSWRAFRQFSRKDSVASGKIGSSSFHIALLK